MAPLSFEAAKLRQILIESRVMSFYERLFGLPFLSQRMRLSAIVNALGISPGQKVRLLDAGCAWGILFSELSRTMTLECLEIVGQDLSLQALKDACKLARRAGVKAFHAVVSDLRFLPFAEDSLDKAVCSEVLEHVVDDQTALSELRRILRLQGTLVVTVPNSQQKTTWVSTSSKELWDHVREGYSLEALRDLMEKHGFRIRGSKHIGNLFGGVAWEVSFRLLSPVRPFLLRSIIEVLTFPLFYGVAKLDSWSGERPWGKWLLLQTIKA